MYPVVGVENNEENCEYDDAVALYPEYHFSLAGFLHLNGVGVTVSRWI